jgi:hypothetical protein
MPGERLLTFARAWFDDSTVSKVFEPLLADWQHELASLSGARRAWCRLGGYATFTIALTLALPRQMAKPVPADVTRAMVIFIACFVAAGTTLSYLAFSYGANETLPWSLLPALVATATPLASLPMILLAARTPGSRSQDIRSATLRMLLVSLALLVPLLGWITPAANQRVREARWENEGRRAVLIRGVRELSLPELIATQPPADLPMPSRSRPPGQRHDPRPEELHNRAATLTLPIVLSTVGLALTQRRSSVAVACAWWLGAAAIWLLGGTALRSYFRTHQLELIGYWSPHIVLIAITCIASWRRAARASQVA